MHPEETDLIDLDAQVPAEPTQPMELAREESQPQKTSFTTANGDGLTFDPESLSIFDQIQLIIDGKDVVEKAIPNRRVSVRPEQPQ